MHGDNKFMCTYDEPPVKNLNFYLLFLRSLESDATQSYQNMKLASNIQMQN